MLKINPAPTFEFDAQITVPGAEQQAVVRVTAKHKGRDALQAWVGSAQSGGGDAQFLGNVIVGWAGVFDEQGNEAPFGEAALAKLLDAYPAAGGELFEQYLAALTQSRRKN